MQEIKKKNWMKKLKKMNDNELERFYNEMNLVISKVKGMMARREPLGKNYKDYAHAKKTRARILTVINQRRYEREFRMGVK